MLELLREHQIGPRFRALMIGAQKAKGAPIALIAVPFWGKGAIKILGLGGGKNVWIICNLNSTARNPHVIENLKKLEGVKIRSHARLHAKIYAGPKFVIVGSSNASTNGLTEEGDAALGWIEANIATDNPQVVQLVRKLFDKLWNSRESTPVNASALNRAKIAYKNRPWNNRPANATTLLAACRENPTLFQSFFVGTYNQDLGPNGSKSLLR